MIEEFELLQKIQNDTDRNLKVKSMPGKKTRWLFHTEFVGYILYSREDGVLLNHNLQMCVLFCDLAAHVRLYIYMYKASVWNKHQIIPEFVILAQ